MSVCLGRGRGVRSAVERLQLLKIPRERRWILQTDRDERAELEDVLGGVQEVCGCGGGGDEGVLLEEGDLGFGEELGRAGGGVREGVFELGC